MAPPRRRSPRRATSRPTGGSPSSPTPPPPSPTRPRASPCSAGASRCRWSSHPPATPGMMHHHGESAVARVAEHVGIPYTLSTMGSTSIEDVRLASPRGDLWFQLYLTADDELNET